MKHCFCWAGMCPLSFIHRQMAAARCLSHTLVSRSAAVTPVLPVLVLLLLPLGTPQGPDLLVICQVSGLHVHGDREAGGSRPAVMQ